MSFTFNDNHSFDNVKYEARTYSTLFGKTIFYIVLVAYKVKLYATEIFPQHITLKYFYTKGVIIAPRSHAESIRIVIPRRAALMASPPVRSEFSAQTAGI